MLGECGNVCSRGEVGLERQGGKGGLSSDVGEITGFSGV